MGLPSPEQLAELSGKIEEQGRLCHGAWGKFTSVLKSIALKLGPTAVQTGATQGASALGVSSGLQVAAVSVGGVSVGVTLAPIGAALAPWIGAAMIACQAGKIFGLYDLRDDALKGGNSPVLYSCRCGKCAKNIQYIIDKKERNVALVAVGVGTLGVSAIFKGFHSFGKKVYSAAKGETRPKEQVSRDLVTSARGGCTAAMGVIFLLSGSWSLTGPRDAETMATAVAIMTSSDGWEKLKSNW
jgi:hypothetical protein